MTLENKEKIDLIGIDNRTNEVVLTIVDHLEWNTDGNAHISMLQEKINTYLAFIESGEIYQSYPKAKGKKIVIETLGSTSLNEIGEEFYDKASAVVSNAGFQLRFSLLPQKSH